MSRSFKTTSLILLCCAAAGAYYWYAKVARLKANPLANVPSSTVALAHIQVASLRGTDTWESQVVAQGGEAALRQLEAECGFDWSADLQGLTIFITEDREVPADRQASGDAAEDMLSLSHVAFILQGSFPLEEIAECMQRIAPSEEDAPSLERISVRGVQAMTDGNGYIVASVSGGLLLGHITVVEDTIDVLRGDMDSAEESGALALFRDISAGNPTAHGRAAVRLDGRWREALLSGLSSVGLEETLEAPTSLAASLHAGEGLRLQGVAAFENPGPVQDFANALRRLLADAKDNMLISLTPIGRALDTITITPTETGVRVEAQLTSTLLGALIEMYVGD